MSEILDLPRLSPSQAARKVRVHVATVWRWMLHGVRGHKLPSTIIGGRRYIFEKDLQAWAAGNEPHPNDDVEFKRRAINAGKILDGLGADCAPNTSRDIKTPN